MISARQVKYDMAMPAPIRHAPSPPLLLVSCLVLVAARDFTAASTSGAPAPADATIKIGAVVATSGPAGLLGDSFLKAIRLAKEELKNTTHQYELVVKEIASPDKAEPAIEKLIKIDKVDALVVGFSISGEIVKPYAAAAKIPLFCICSVGSVGDDLYTFTIMPLAEDEAMRWVAEAKRRGIRRIAALTQNYPSIGNHVKMLKVEAAKAGITFVYEDRFVVLCRSLQPRSRSFGPAAQAGRRPQHGIGRGIFDQREAGTV